MISRTGIFSQYHDVSMMPVRKWNMQFKDDQTKVQTNFISGRKSTSRLTRGHQIVREITGRFCHILALTSSFRVETEINFTWMDMNIYRKRHIIHTYWDNHKSVMSGTGLVVFSDIPQLTNTFTPPLPQFNTKVHKCSLNAILYHYRWSFLSI